MSKSALKSKSKSKSKSKVKVKPSRLVDKSELRLGDSVWPVERDVLFRPDRLKYVRKIIKPKGCVFCESAQEGPSLESLCLVKTKHAMVVLNKFPYNSGHLLVIPRRHVGEMELLSDVEYAETQFLIRYSIKALQEVYAPGGINMGLNLGASAGAGIPEHLHYHIVPRWSGDLNFYPLIANTKVVVESLEETYAKLVAYIKNNKVPEVSELSLNI